jgi:hypothetical protein
MVKIMRRSENETGNQQGYFAAGGYGAGSKH